MPVNLGMGSFVDTYIEGEDRDAEPREDEEEDEDDLDEAGVVLERWKAEREDPIPYDERRDRDE